MVAWSFQATSLPQRRSHLSGLGLGWSSVPPLFPRPPPVWWIGKVETPQAPLHQSDTPVWKSNRFLFAKECKCPMCVHVTLCRWGCLSASLTGCCCSSGEGRCRGFSPRSPGASCGWTGVWRETGTPSHTESSQPCHRGAPSWGKTAPPQEQRLMALLEMKTSEDKCGGVQWCNPFVVYRGMSERDSSIYNWQNELCFAAWNLQTRLFLEQPFYLQ